MTAPDLDIAELLVGGEHQIRASRFVQFLVITIFTLPAGQEEPPLVDRTPRSRFVDYVALVKWKQSNI